MLQATMGGSEAGTKYNAFLKSAAKGGKELGLNFLDANNQLLSMPEILDKLRGKFGETMDAAEKIKIQEAFGDQEAVALIDLLYNKTGDLQNNILSLYDSMGQGRGVAEGMADAMNQMEPDQFTVLQQKIQNVKETLGNSLMPTVNVMIDKGSQAVDTVGRWAQEHQDLVQVLMLVVLALGGVFNCGRLHDCSCRCSRAGLYQNRRYGCRVYRTDQKAAGSFDNDTDIRYVCRGWGKKRLHAHKVCRRYCTGRCQAAGDRDL